MNERDFHYYASFEQMGQSFYDWQRHIINLGCNVADVDIADILKEPNTAGSNQTGVLIHEYTHFLQNFATTWGAPVFTDFALALMKIGGSSAQSKEIIHLPIDIGKLKNELLAEGFLQREKVIQRLNRFNDVEYVSNAARKAIELSIIEDNCALLDNGHVKAQLGIKLIREHMAHMATQLFLGKTDDQIHEYNLNTIGFKENNIQLSKCPEYWILFEYIYEFGKITEIGFGILYLTQACLVTLNPEKALMRFLKFFDSHVGSTKKQTELYNIVKNWLRTREELKFQEVGYKSALAHCKGIRDLTNKYSDNDLMVHVNKLANYAISNIKKTKGGKTLFKREDQFMDVSYWKNKMLEFGTCPIKYIDNTLIHGSKKHIEEMHDSFVFLTTCSLALKMILENRKLNCPFLYDIPICTAPFYDSPNCAHNPFLMTVGDAEGKHCSFGSGVIILGLDGRVDFGSNEN